MIDLGSGQGIRGSIQIMRLDSGYLIHSVIRVPEGHKVGCCARTDDSRLLQDLAEWISLVEEAAILPCGGQSFADRITH